MEFVDSEAFWEDLPNQWRNANYDARKLRVTLNAAVLAARKGEGPLPSQEAIDACLNAERHADKLGEELATIVERAFLG